MAFDCFLNVQDIPGESKDSAHESWIEIDSFNHGLTQPIGGPASTAGALSAERCDHSFFSITKKLDKASPKLAEACCKGLHIPLVELSLNRATGDKAEYMNYKLTDCMVTAYSPGGSSGGGDVPSEEVSFTYGKIEWTYTQLSPDGSSVGQVAAGWNCETNEPI